MTPSAGTPLPVQDAHGRWLNSLRISVTDRCNLRCRYCMPEEDYVWLPRGSILHFEEIARLVQVFTTLGVTKVRLTGGEPLLRHDLPTLVTQLKANHRIRDLAITTNGVMLARHAAALKAAGLDRVTVSLDTLQPDRFKRFSGRARFTDVIEGIEAVRAAGFRRTKVNAVIVRGFNEDELVDLLEFGRERRLEVRFIEYMDVGGATQWSPADVVPRAEILERLDAHYGGTTPLPDPSDGRAPAERFALPNATTFGIIASTTRPFCGMCGRARLTADGMWFMCLYADRGVDLRDLLRSGASDDEIAAKLGAAWQKRTDRGAEDRLTSADRGPLYQLDRLRQDPHREMHTRGG
ncbi:MAG: GTP 3',8-cyclase MoaA [Gemmatimonadota bacterium]|nr:GTP 3',8-cyclase MoaA [Gemmatimonadota bacterium]MDH3367004.1 GTP 3',8-cyclase MoaA [Gemmatimonadota bacterium]MDH3476750.1 GTP 3',8-cyclase MoaA [Gemmatimonadota bacterium]MDH3571031.1 GTP 3',8-cyclase MoaA [Gemmatimonadota bacterium]MDH5550891.1 GTP 3',8-cyclase MoaA [Gemmatimonadota bacterium]